MFPCAHSNPQAIENKMLFASTTNATGEIGAIATTAFGNVAPFVYFIAGIVLAFWILEMLSNILWSEKQKREETLSRADRAEKELHEIL